MTDGNGRTIALNDWAAKARCGTVTHLNEAAGTVTVTWQDSTSSTFPAAWLATTSPAEGDSFNGQPWVCYGKYCGF